MEIDSPEKFLGAKITFKGKSKETYEFIQKGIIDCLENIDATLVSKDHKLQIYVKYMIPAIRFRLTVHKITKTDLKYQI